jgi:hypothetical protein
VVARRASSCRAKPSRLKDFTHLLIRRLKGSGLHRDQ